MEKEQNHWYGRVKFKLNIMTFITVMYASLLMAVLIPKSFGEEGVFITVVNRWSLRADGSSPLYQCYKTTDSTTRRYGRYLNTRNGDEYNLPPRPAKPHWVEPKAQIAELDTTNSNGFGIFYCQGFETNKRVSTVPTILLRSDAKIHPKGGFFTQTVNVGDQDVVLEAEPTDGDMSRVTEVLWRFNDTTPYVHQGSFSYTIPQVSKENEGAYEIHYGEELRDQARHAIMRLIVRDCPANRWGPPGCHDICDKCYNGGICHARSGKCICPPGFMGYNCLTGCGGNSFGLNCEFQCSSGNPQPDSCDISIFCLPDPYGCTCNTGFQSLQCMEFCPTGKFGAGCTQDCRCTGGSCNKYTGACEGGNYCLSGWSGDSCQIPDVCENDYFGAQCTRKCHCLNDQPCNKDTGECPYQQCASGYKVYNDDINCQECRGSTFGFQCSGVCRCQVENCDKVTGQCNGGCLENWVQPDCLTGIKSLSNTKVNPGQKTVFTCRVTGNPTPAREMVILERLGGATNGITFKSTSVQDQDRSVQFDVNSVAAREKMVCRLMGYEPGALKQIQANTYVLPELSSPPRVIGIGGLWADIEWDAWNNNTDAGDPPVVAYKVHYRLSGSSSWTSMDISSSNGLNTRLSGLRWETSYLFAISAVRSETGGEGPRGPSSGIETTTCADPLAPQGLMAFTDPNVPKQIMVQWQEPDDFQIRCSTGAMSFTVYYRHKYQRNDGIVTVGPGTMVANLEGLEVFTDYLITVTMRNGVGVGPKSEAIHYYSPEEVAPPPMKPNITMTTLDSVTLSLKAAEPYNLNGHVRSYEVEYQRLSPEEGTRQIMSIFANPMDFTMEATLQNLTDNSNYSIRVQLENGIGVSDWSEPVYAMTANMAHVESFSNTELTTGIVSALLVCIIIIIIVVLVVVLRRRRRNSTFHTTGHQGGTTRKDNEQILMVSTDKEKGERGEESHGAQPPIPNTTVAMTIEDTNEDYLIPIDGEAQENEQEREYEDPDIAVEEESWEIPWEKLMLGTTILGKGNFGEVREGVVWKNEKEVVKVAVKSLKEGAALADEKDFRDELETMKKVGSHPNIVTLIGSCIHEGILYVALELIELGNLRSFLRKVRKDGSYAQWVEQLLTFAVNVASGMRYLANIGVIHRDLAARNVLLGDNYVAKVSDFGLSRDEDIYVQKSKTRIPVRWMPPESIRFQRYTSKSDVWSFGVLLWEIGALGGTPYAGIDSKELISKLKDGYRMPKPDKCANDMYDVMAGCWQFDPDLRPTFRELHRTLSCMLDENQIYMRFEVYENVKLSPINTDRDDC